MSDYLFKFRNITFAILYLFIYGASLALFSSCSVNVDITNLGSATEIVTITSSEVQSLNALKVVALVQGECHIPYEQISFQIEGQKLESLNSSANILPSFLDRG